MINKVCDRGDDMGALIRYLFGPGLANEHSDPHIIGSHHGLAAEGAPRFTDDGQLRALWQELDAPKSLFDVEVKGGHVWHLVLSNPTTDRLLSDDEWGIAAQAAVDAMGFGQASGRAQCRWVGVRHGLSSEGNDHIHVVVNLVREDGTKASVWRERLKTAAVAQQMEKQFGLTVVHGRQTRSTPGYHRAEKETAKRQQRPEPARFTLARTVRAASVAASSEAEFVRRLRKAGLKVRPRYAAGGTSEVVGYSVALRPGSDGKTVWYGGGTLAADLGLPALRGHWADDAPERLAAVSEWRAAGAGKRPAVRDGRETRARDDAAWERAAERLGIAVHELAAVPVDDLAAWAGVARETAGVVASLSARLEGQRPGELARTADVLARSAQTPRGAASAAPPSAVRDFRGVGMVISQAAPGGSATVGQVLILRQLSATMQAIHDAHRARGEAGHAAAVADAARSGLAAVHDRLNQSPDHSTEVTPESSGTRAPERGTTEQIQPRINPRGPELGR